MGFRISPKTILNFSIVLFIVSAGFLLLPKPAQAAITFNAETGISGLWRYDNGTGTFTSLGAGATNFDYFTDDCEAGDYLMIASSNINHARNIKLNVGTAFAASSVEFIWEYEETLDVWKPFNNVVDNTNNLSVLDENWVFYDMPERWDAFSKSGIGYYTFLRLRIVSVTAPTEGGRQGATTVKRGDNTLLISGEGTLASPITWDTVYQADLAGGGSANPAGAWGVVTKEGIGHYQATRIGVTISSNSYMKSENEVFEWYGNTVKWWETFSCAGYYRMGIKAGDGSIHSGGRLITAGGYRMTFSGPTYIYDSTIYERIYSDPHIAFSGNPTEFKRVNVESTKFGIGGSNWSVDDFYYYHGFGFMIGSQPTLFKGYKARAVDWPIYFYMDAAENIEVKDADVQKILYYRRNVDSYMINHIVPLDNITLTFLGVAGTTYTGRLFDTYTFDLKVIDKDNNPINGASVKITDNQSNEWNLTTDANGKITQQKLHKAHYAYVPGSAGGDNVYVKTDYNPFKIRISSQNYPSREFEFTLDKKTDWVLALKDRPMSVGTVKVWGTEYADDEAGTIYAQVTYGDGTPCNTIASTDITAMVYKSNGSKIIDGANMTYVDGSNGIYKHDFSGSTFSAEGVYIIDVKASSTSPSITAYDSNEIHISKTANRIKTMVSDIWDTATSTLTTAGSIGKLLVDNIDAKISGVAGEVWGYTGRSLDTIDNIISGVWGESQAGYTTSGTFGYYLNSRISVIASDVWNYTSSIGSDLIQNLGDAIWNSYSGVRKLTSRQIGTGEYISGESTAEKPTEYNIELVRKATFDFAGIADSGSTTTLVDAELTQPDDHWNNYELWMMSGNNIGLKRAICDFDKASHTITLCGDPLSQAIAAGDQYVISHERKLVHAIWNWSERTLTSAANIAGDIWGYSGGRTLSAFGDLAADVWNAAYAPTRRLTDKTLTGGGSLATESYLDTMKTDIIAEIDANEAKIDNIYTDTQYIRGKADDILAKWGAYSAADIIGYVDEVESRLGTSTDSSATETIFGRTKYLQEKWGTQTGQAIYDKAEAARALITEVQTELDYHGKSTTAYEDIQTLKGYIDDLETLTGQPTDSSSASTLFGKIKGVREQTDKLVENIIVAEVSVNDASASTTQFITDLTQTTNDFYNDGVLVFTSGNNAGQVRRITDYDGTLKKITVDPALSTAPANSDTFSILSQTAIAGIDAQTIWTYGTRTLTAANLDSGSLATLADLQKQWTVYLSDVGEVLAGGTYRAKLSILNWESAPADSYATPTVTIYDSNRNKVVENVEMTKLSTGIYEYTYSVPSSAASGIWETEVSAEVESGKIIKTNDYWEVEASPAKVRINEITDNTVPSIVANVTITNEGTAGYEYQYEYCLVDALAKRCGIDDNIDYAAGAKFLLAGQSWTTDLGLTVPNPGAYWYKLVVYWGTERSVAIRQFDAVSEVVPPPPPPPSGGGGAPPPTPPLVVCMGADFNKDSIVNSVDFSILLYFWKTQPPFRNPCVDINQDGRVDSIDFFILLYQWGKPGTPYKPPAT